MDQLKSRVNKNLQISFFITLGYLIFIILLYYFFDKEAKPLVFRDTEYKMLYFVDSYDNSSGYLKIYDIPSNQTSFIPPIGEPAQIPSNTYRINIDEYCDFTPEKNELTYIPSISFEPYPSDQPQPSPLQSASRSIEVYRKTSIRVPYVYDFKTNNYYAIPCAGTFDLNKLSTERSPDGMVDFYPHTRLTSEESLSKYEFPFLGQKQREMTEDYTIGDMLVNGKFGTADELGIVFNPYFNSPADLWYQVSVLGWFK
jgi:hypothetical protein